MNWRRLVKATLATNVLAVATGIAKTELTLWAAVALEPLWARMVAYGSGIFVLVIMAPLSTWLAWKITNDGLGLRRWWAGSSLRDRDVLRRLSRRN